MFAGWRKGVVLALLMVPFVTQAAIEQTFAVLQVGTHTYKNVTVTTKAKSYIFILHSTGMNNVKVADLPDDVRDKLGYGTAAAAEAARAGTNAISSWAKQTMAKIETPQIKQLEQAISNGSAGTLKASFSSVQLLPLLLFVVAFHLIFSLCARLICRKTGNEGGVLVFLPILQWVPMFRAAGMSPGWLVAMLLPGINLFAFITWAINITEARGKSGWVALFLILPFTNVLAYLYLALSDGTPDRKEDRRIEIMTLETA
jgi:hypothetical protein